jgi:hypothetical protein
MRRHWLLIVELWDSSERWRVTHWLCGFGLHWPIKWDESAYACSYDPPEPPEPGFCCQSCGEIREPYRSWLWELHRLGWLLLHREWGAR